jgi:AcrR family transcriptional regulator
VAERWTQERRRQHTRDLLLDAAEEVFATRGFEGASLEEIADKAGYTRGAIYKHFGSKEELFLAVNYRFNESYLDVFADVADPGATPEDLDLSAIAKKWHAMQSRHAHAYGLGSEFNLYLLRNPEARTKVAVQRRKIAELIARFMEEQASNIGLSLKMPAITLARIVLATSDGLEIASYLDGDDDDLYEPFLELLLSAWETPSPPASRTARAKAKPNAKPKGAGAG